MDAHVICFIDVLESAITLKLLYGYILTDEEIAIHEEKMDVVRSIFDGHLAGASLVRLLICFSKEGLFLQLRK